MVGFGGLEVLEVWEDVGFSYGGGYYRLRLEISLELRAA